MAKIHFKQEDLEKIKQAVQEAEKKTAGEIAVGFIKESSNYAFYELMVSVFCGFFYFVAMVFASHGIETMIKNMFWDYTTDHLLLFYGSTTFLVIFLVYWLTNIPFIDRLIIPKSVMAARVNQRAVRYFMESNVYDTRDRTGILIFISALEHRVELLADKGISEKIPQGKWDDTVNHIIKGIKTNRLTGHLCEAIAGCGELLAEHFPIQPDDENELTDGIAILEE